MESSTTKFNIVPSKQPTLLRVNSQDTVVSDGCIVVRKSQVCVVTNRIVASRVLQVCVATDGIVTSRVPHVCVVTTVTE